jgi:hypothetical protein
MTVIHPSTNVHVGHKSLVTTSFTVRKKRYLLHLVH